MLTYLKEPVRGKKVVPSVKSFLCNLENQSKDPKHLCKKLSVVVPPFCHRAKVVQTRGSRELDWQPV